MSGSHAVHASKTATELQHHHHDSDLGAAGAHVERHEHLGVSGSHASHVCKTATELHHHRHESDWMLLPGAHVERHEHRHRVTDHRCYCQVRMWSDMNIET